MNNFFTVFRNTLFLTISGIIIKLLGMVWLIYLAQPSVERFGTYNLVNSFIGIFSFLPDFGVGIIVIREIAKNKKSAPVLLGDSLILNTIFATLTFVLVLITAKILGYSGDLLYLTILASLTLFVSTIRSVAVYYFDGIEMMGYSAFFNTLNTILSLLFAFIGERVSGLDGVFLGMLIGTGISTVINWSYLLAKFITPKIQVETQTILRLLKQGAPLGIAAFAALIYSKIDSVVIHSVIGEKALGVYSAAIPFPYALIQLLNVPFTVAVFPALTRLTGDKDRFYKGIYKSIGVILLWSIPSSIVVYFFADMIPLLFGGKYTTAIPILRVAIWVVPFLALSALLYKILIILHKQITYLVTSIFAAILSVILDIVFTKQYGNIGAAGAVVLTQAIVCVAYAVITYITVKSYYEDFPSRPTR